MYLAVGMTINISDRLVFSTFGKVMSDIQVEDHAAHCRMAREIIIIG